MANLSRTDSYLISDLEHARHVATELRLYYPTRQKNDAALKDTDEATGRSKHRKNRKDKSQPTQNKTTGEVETRPVFDNILGSVGDSGRFIRLSLNTCVCNVKTFLFDGWRIRKPHFIVSIIGGAKYFKMKEQQLTNFTSAIIELLTKPNTWLITNGYDSGITQAVGQALHEFKLSHTSKDNQSMTSISICKWGCIKDIEDLVAYGDSNKTSNTRDTYVSAKAKSTERQRGEWHLEMNHDYYVMLDDGTQRSYDTADYRTCLINKVASVNTNDGKFVPVVTILVEGGLQSIANVYYDLNSNIPVVMIQDSGRAADFFCRWLLRTKDLKTKKEIKKSCSNHQKPCDNHPTHCANYQADPVKIDDKTVEDLEEFFKDHIQQLLEDIDETFFSENGSKKKEKKSEDIDDLLHQVLFCLHPTICTGITVFNLSSNPNLPDAIFECICRSREQIVKVQKCKHYNEMENSKNKKQNPNERTGTGLLELAMDWNCIDPAKDFVFKSSLNNIINPKRGFIQALKKNLPSFVYEFLRLGYNPTELIFPKDNPKNRNYNEFIQELYLVDIAQPTKTHFKYFIEDPTTAREGTVKTLDSLNLVLYELIGYYMHQIYFSTANEEFQYKKKHRLLINWANTEQFNSNDDEDATHAFFDDTSQTKAYDYVMRDLFLWAVLMNRIEIAKVLLCFMKYRICSALIATKILKKYYKAADYGPLKDGYEKNSIYFEKYAVDCIDFCDDDNAEKACEIVLQQNELYGYVSCLQVASDAKDKLFISAPCPAQAINNVWFNKLHPEQKRIRDGLAIFVSIISFGLLAPLFVRYREKKVKKIGRHGTQKFEEYGIDYNNPTKIEYDSEKEFSFTSYFPKVKKFHHSLPVKAIYQFATYLFFLLLFSYTLLFNFSPATNASPSIYWTEILTIIYVICISIEEIRLLTEQEDLSFWGKADTYFRDYFKRLTLIALILFYAGLIVRFTHGDSEDNFMTARIVMAIDLELWWIRCLSFIIVIPFLGPHLVAIGKMLKDLGFFLLILAVVIIGYGVAAASMVYYPKANNFTTEAGGTKDTSFSGRAVLRNILYPVYYLLHGEFGNQLSDLDSNADAGWSLATHVLLAIHMIFVNILLLNLLIAMFSKRFEEVYVDTTNIWHSQQYLFTREYFARSVFMPPVSVLIDIFYLIAMIVNKCKAIPSDGIATSYDKSFKIIPMERSIIEDWYKFEDRSTNEYAHREVKALKAAQAKSKSGPVVETKKTKKDTSKTSDDDIETLTSAQNDMMNLRILINEMSAGLDGLNLNADSDNESEP